MIATLLSCALLTASQLPMVFLSINDISAPTGVTVDAMLPTEGVTLFPKGPEGSTLWTAPIAALTDNGTTRIWYQRVNKAEKEYSDQRTLCVGELRGDTWTLPALDASPAPWGGPNNVCMRRSPYKPTWGGFNVFQIVRDGEMFRMLYWDQPAETGEAGAMLAASKDGIQWSQDARGAVFTEHNDAYSLLSTGPGYLLFQTALEPWPDKPYPDNLDKFKRVLCIRDSKDLTSWTPQQVFLRPDQEDAPETEFYLMKAFRYGQGYAGLIMKYYADPKMPNKHSAIMKYELIVSRDARQWERPYRNVDLGFWTYADPFELAGRTHFVVWKDGAMKTVAYRRFGLTGARAAERGTFTTAPFDLPESGITLNVNAGEGNVEVTLLNENGEAVAGAESVKLAQLDDERARLPFSPDTMRKVAGKSCRLQIKLEQATVYSVDARL